jgi:hypothetical protein
MTPPIDDASLVEIQSKAFDYFMHEEPIALMIENYRNGLLWRIMRECPYIVSGLRRAGFKGGWL